MKKKIIIKKLLGIIVILNACVCLFVSCNKTAVNIDRQTPFDITKEHIQNFEANISQNGTHKSKLMGDSVIRTNLDNNKSYLEFFKNMNVYFYANDGRTVQNHIQSKYCKFYEDLDEKVVLKKNVVVRNNKGEVLMTEELFWDTKDRMFYTNKYFTFSSPSQVLRGNGMRANEDLSQIQTFKTAGNFRVEGSSSGNSSQKKSSQQQSTKKTKSIKEQFDF